MAKAISISHAKFYSNRLTTEQDIQDYASLIFWGDTMYKTTDNTNAKDAILVHTLK